MRSIFGKLYQNVTSLKAVSFVAVSAIAVITPVLFSQNASALNSSVKYLSASPSTQNLEIDNTTYVSVKAVFAKTGILSYAQLVSQNASITATVTSGEISTDCLDWTTTTATFNLSVGDTADVSFCYKGTELGLKTINFTSAFPWGLGFAPLGGVKTPSTTANITVIDTTAPTGLFNLSPSNDSFKTTANQTDIDWTDAIDLISNPVSYYYQSSYSSDVDEDGSFMYPLYTSEALSVSNILTPDTPEGVYYWHVRAVDSLGNSTPWTESWKFTVDNTKPVIIIRPVGESEQVDVTIEAGDIYIDQGATWTDGSEEPTDVTEEDKVSNVDTTTPGEYTVVYSHTDSAGNTGTATRNVTVVDTTKPIVTLNGSDEITLENGATYTELGATWTDIVDGEGDVTDISGSVDTAVAGIYTITYSYTDEAGNTGTATRKVTVKPAPVVVSESTNTPVRSTTPTITSNIGMISTGEVKGDSTSSDNNGSVESTSDSKDKTSDSDSDNNSVSDIFGLAWYWWLAILAALGGLWWFLFGRKKKENEE